MKTITLSTSGLAISTAFTTVVKKLTAGDSVSKVVLDEMPHVELSVSNDDVKTLDLKKGSSVTLAPVDGSADKSFTMTINETVAAPVSTPTNTGKGNSPAFGMTFSNAL